MNPLRLIILLFSLYGIIQLNAQNEIVSSPPDTVRKVVEVVRYEYYEPEPFHLRIGTGFNLNNIHFKSDLHNEASFQLGVPLAVQLAKGHFFLETGIALRNFKFYKDRIKQVGVKEPYSAVETVVVDTIYKDNNGVFEPYIITKDVEVTKYKTIVKDEAYRQAYNYSTYSVPLVLGYQFDFKKFSAQVGLGASLNFYTPKAKSQLKIDFPDEKNVFTAGIASLGINYHVTDKVILACHISTLKKWNDEVYDYQENQGSLKIFYQLF